MTTHRAIDVRCPTCGTPPGQRCRSQALTARNWPDPILNNRPHTERRQAARAATAAADPTRCPRCGQLWRSHTERHQEQP